MSPQDSIATTFYDDFSASLLEESLLELHPKSGKGYVRADTLRPGECYIMPFPEDSIAARDTVVMSAAEMSAKYGFHPSLPGLSADSVQPYRNMGQPGDPVPYTVRGDNSLTILLLLCFVVFIVSLGHSKHFLARQLKNFFWPPHHDGDDGESGGELRFVVFLSIVNTLVLAISTYLLATDLPGRDPKAQGGMGTIAALFAAFAAYYALKMVAASVVNMTFFGVKKNLQWTTLCLQIAAMQGVLLFPVLALQIYFDFSAENAIIYICLVLFLNKILTFYKCHQIFFHRKGLYLQTFLYFCALEIAPLLALAGTGLAVFDMTKVNF